MNKARVRFAVVLVLAVADLFGVGCSKPPQLTARPTAFCEWCQSEKFGVKPAILPQEVMIKSSNTNVSGGLIGLANYRTWSMCKSEEEARKFLDTIFAELKSVAQSKGISLQESKDVPDLPGNGLVWRYKSESIHGTLEGTYESGVLGGSKEGEAENPNKGYWVNLKLTEVVRAP